ncbi:MAG: histone deacetylase, partial [Acidobacteriota bacterium]|nr:histone deacetylase [Acidobacteriota bacterium]
MWGGGERVDLVYSPDYGVALPTSALDVERGKRVLTFLASERLLRRRRLHRPEPASLRFLGRIHPDTYLESLQETEALLPILGFEVDQAGHDALLDAHRSMVGGTALATRLARSRNGVVVNLGGGFHHARADRGQGFCVFNDVAAAIAAERSRGMNDPVLVVDLDLHDGEGTRAIFAEDETVHTFSIHNRHLGPTEARASTSIELGEHVEDATYLETVRSRLPEIVERTDPGLVFYLAGVDPAADDLMGNWEITAAALLARDLFVSETTRAGRQAGLVVLLAGGYGKRAWRYSARFLARLLAPGREIEPPATDDLSLAEYRHIARRLEPVELARDEPASDWSITEEDVMGALRHTSGASRFLDYYSRHGVEVAFERYGIMDRLRDLGFGRLRVEIDLEDAVGQTLAVVSDDFPSEPLIELRVDRDAVSIPGMELLRVEWLQLRNPQREFTETRPRLP